MAIKLISRYSKKLGLPGFSSHEFSVSVETELATTDDIPGEAQRLYQLLQTNVDEQLETTGFVPPADYGMEEESGDNPGHTNGSNGNNGSGPLNGGRWKCSDKQRDLILKLVDEHRLDKQEVQKLACERFGKGVRALGKLEASDLIDELLEAYGGRNGGTNGR
jgi:hypothetical protein